MALEFICSKRIVEGKKIVLPRESSNGKILKYIIHREIGREDREIEFFYEDNNEEEIFALDIWNAPKGARKMEFSIYRKYKQDILEVPVFYGSEEEILKIGNR